MSCGVRRPAGSSTWAVAPASSAPASNVSWTPTSAGATTPAGCSSGPCRRRGPSVQADAQRLPFRSGSFDAVVCTEAFHWFPDPDAALAELRRVLVPDGRVVVGSVNLRTAPVSRLAGAVSSGLGQPAHWATRSEMRARVERAGFDDVRQRRIVRVGGVTLPTVLTVATRAD